MLLIAIECIVVGASDLGMPPPGVGGCSMAVGSLGIVDIVESVRIVDTAGSYSDIVGTHYYSDIAGTRYLTAVAHESAAGNSHCSKAVLAVVDLSKSELGWADYEVMWMQYYRRVN